MALTPARKIGEGVYDIESFSGAGSYRVDLSGLVPSCGCPHFQMRLAGTNKGLCKHIVSVQAQRERIELIEKARRCTDKQIAALLPKHAADPMVSGALRIAREERRQDLIQADYDAHMKSIFA